MLQKSGVDYKLRKTNDPIVKKNTLNLYWGKQSYFWTPPQYYILAFSNNKKCTLYRLNNWEHILGTK